MSERQFVAGQFVAETVFLQASKMIADYPALQNNLDFKALVDAHTHNLVLQLRTWCLSGQIPSRKEDKKISWPDGVWQMFKYKYMPLWFVDRFPVRMESEVVETATHHYFVCPHLVTKEQGYHVQFMATGTDMAKYFGGHK